MQFKQEFIVEDWRLKYLDKGEMLRRYQEGKAADLGVKMLESYPFEIKKKSEHGETRYILEIIATTAKKYYAGYESIKKILAFHPELQSLVLERLREMQSPDIEPKQPL